MVHIPAGTFWMGTDDSAFPDAQPLHRVRLKAFWIDQTEVTNEQFNRFVDATGYITVAERQPEPKDYPGTPVAQLVPGSLVFAPPADARNFDNAYAWWSDVPGACWHKPEGAGTSLENRWNHPVVHVTFEDAAAYAKWAGKRLPTEAEFEYASRGGLDRQKFSWGSELCPEGKHQSNLWQGKFPVLNTKADGFVGTAPVRSFAPNRWGLYDTTGNVWEWCSDWYRPDYYKSLSPLTFNPKGPDEDAAALNQGALKKVQKGGSFLCTDQYCARYVVGSRGKSEYRSPHCHAGFRCVSDQRPR